MYEGDIHKFPCWSLAVAGAGTYYDSSLTLAVLYANNGQTVDIFKCASTEDDVKLTRKDESSIDTHNEPPAGLPPIYADNAGSSNTLVARFTNYNQSIYTDMRGVNANLPNDPSYVIDPAVPNNPWPGRPVLADGPDMSLVKAYWLAYSGGVIANFPAKQYANHSYGANVLFADSSVQFIQMHANGTVMEPRLTGTDLIGVNFTANQGEQAIAGTDIYADDALNFVGAAFVYTGDSKIDGHIGSYQPSGATASGNAPWAGPNASGAPFGINDVTLNP
jgi:prepilin-type processing-associated H-X9-DG protein